MFYLKEICNLEEPADSDICVKIAGMSLQNSEWTLAYGLPSAHYFDIDNYLTMNENSKELSQFLSQKIISLSEIRDFDKIAFIDKGWAGPVGLIAISTLVASLTNKEMLIIRPKKKLLRGAVKGNLRKGDKILILSDVATVGWTIFEAAEKIWQLGGKAPCALVVIDRCQGATVNLERKGIELFSLVSAKTLKEKKEKEIQEKFKVTIEERFSPVLIDFGGASSTTIG
ncbi:MAG: hypothetical protein M1508_14485 [Nitrospirae bacterium]|nr:hypothetical protein [Nitrospirota bacterium]MCL5421408.1 hypothetical protein [Nitrospirota bacterium]